MRPDTKLLAWIAGAIVAAAAMSVAGLAALGVWSKSDIAKHTPFHIGCAHHSHGPVWHAGHGKSASYQRPLGGQSEAPQPSGLRSRAMTANR